MTVLGKVGGGDINVFNFLKRLLRRSTYEKLIVFFDPLTYEIFNFPGNYICGSPDSFLLGNLMAVYYSSFRWFLEF